MIFELISGKGLTFHPIIDPDQEENEYSRSEEFHRQQQNKKKDG